MIHLTLGVSVTKNNWLDAMATNSETKFLKILIMDLWEPEEIVKLAVQPERTKDAETRKHVPSAEYCALKRNLQFSVWIKV